MKAVTYQFSLFDYNEMRPRTKVPISKERIEAAKRLMLSDPHGAASALREVREALENYERRIFNGNGDR
jgi:hypothetical protein